MKDFTLALTGTAQRLSDALVNKTPGGPDDVPYRMLHLQPGGANANPIAIGGSAAVTTTLYGLQLPAGSGGIAPAPLVFEFSGEGPVKLSHLWVVGGAGDSLHIFGVPF
jgi:hypothetical protein